MDWRSTRNGMMMAASNIQVAYTPRLARGATRGEKSLKTNLPSVQAMNCLGHFEGGVSRVVALLKKNSTFDVPSDTPISDEQAVMFGWIIPAHSAPKPRTLKFHAKVDDEKQKTCTVWIEDNGRAISEKASGMTVRDIQNFFMKHPSLMLGGHPYDFSTWLVTMEHEEVSVADDLAAFRELGFKFEGE